VGVEPTDDGLTRRPPVLKTGTDHRISMRFHRFIINNIQTTIRK
jgi:hypothetical protein